MLVIVVIYGKVLWDLVDLVSCMIGVVVLIVLIVLLIDIVSVNFVVNFVGLVYDFLVLVLGCISYKVGGIFIVGLVIVMMLWKILVFM